MACLLTHALGSRRCSLGACGRWARGVVGVCWPLPREVGGRVESHLALGDPSALPMGRQVALVGR